MTSRKRRLKDKRKRRVTTGEIIGFSILGLFILFVIYLMIPPQLFYSPTHTDEMTIFTSETSSSLIQKSPMRAAIIDQLAMHWPNQRFISSAETILKNADFTVDVYDPEKVTVDLYGSLAIYEYDLLIFRVHAGVNEQMEGHPVGLFTTESYSELKYSWEQLNDVVGSAQAFNQSEVVFAVTPKFIRDKSVMDYNGAVIILMGCFGVYSSELPQAFIDRGASIVIGWDGLVSLEYTDKATLTLLENMLLEEMSIEKAVKETMRREGPDPYNDSILLYYPPERSILKVSDIFMNQRVVLEVKNPKASYS